MTFTYNKPPPARYFLERQYPSDTFHIGDMVRVYRQGIGRLPSIFRWHATEATWVTQYIDNDPSADDFVAMYLGSPDVDDIDSYIKQFLKHHTTMMGDLSRPMPTLHCILWNEEKCIVEENTLLEWFYVYDETSKNSIPL